MSAFLVSQILAAGTLIVGMAAFQFRQRTHMLRGWCVAACLASAHFYFLGSVEAAALVAVTASRFLVSSLSTNRRLMWLFLLLAVAGFTLTYQSPVSFLALAATLIGTVGSFHGTEKAVHYAMMAAELLWTVHNIIVWSPVAIVMELLFFTSNLVGLLRHRRARASAL